MSDEKIKLLNVSRMHFWFYLHISRNLDDHYNNAINESVGSGPEVVVTRLRRYKKHEK